MSDKDKPIKMNLKEEFLEWFDVSPRVWLVLAGAFVLSVFLGFLLGVLFMLVAFY